MGKLIVFNFLTLNGFFKGPGGDISWHKHTGEEEKQYSIDAMKAGNTLLYGRVTYEMMQWYWTSPLAAESDPVMARSMTEAEKIVFSTSLVHADWNNTRVVNNDMLGEVQRLKAAGKGLAVLGSGSIVTQLAEAGLVDEYQVMIDPIALGEGTPMFSGLKRQLNLELLNARTFKSGVVLLIYRSA